MFKYFLISVVIAPLLAGVLTVKGRDRGGDLSALKVTWITYAILWFGVLYYLRYRWS